MELRGFRCGTEGVELRGFWCGTAGGGGTEGFLVWNSGGCVELRGLWCGTEGFLALNFFLQNAENLIKISCLSRPQ